MLKYVWYSWTLHIQESRSLPIFWIYFPRPTQIIFLILYVKMFFEKHWHISRLNNYTSQFSFCIYKYIFYFLVKSLPYHIPFCLSGISMCLCFYPVHQLNIYNKETFCTLLALDAYLKLMLLGVCRYRRCSTIKE